MRRISIFLLLLIISLSPGFSQVNHVEPPNWWSGFKDPNLQIMIHGNNIANKQVEISHKGITLKQVILTENPNYLFVNITISPKIEETSFDILLKQKERIVEKIPYKIHKRRKNSKDRIGFNSSDMVYLITPDRFSNGNPKNDQVKGMFEKKDRENIDGRHGGDIKGIIEHLDYLQSIGATALWINPMNENNMEQGSYHGYAITNFYKIDPRYGSNEKYKELSKLCHERGIKLIQDFVFNHCGSNHWWMKDLPSKDWINYGKYVASTHKHTTLIDTHASKRDRKLMTDGWFAGVMPDLNQRNELLKSYLIQNTIWWTEYANLDGIRVDTWPYSDKKMITEWAQRYTTEYPNINIVGEEWNLNPAVISYWQKGKHNHDGYNPTLPSLMDFPIQHAFAKSLVEKDSWNTGWMTLYKKVSLDFVYPNSNNLMIFPDNHDMSRIYKQLGEDPQLQRLALAFYATFRGIPQIFYGTEILMSNPRTDEHGEIRSDFPGGWKGDRVNAFTQQGLAPEQVKTQNYFKQLFNWRKGNDAVHHGKLIHFDPENSVYTYFRIGNKGAVMVILNKVDEEKTIDPSIYNEILKDYKRKKNIITDKETDVKAGITIPAKSPLIFELY